MFLAFIFFEPSSTYYYDMIQYDYDYDDAVKFLSQHVEGAGRWTVPVAGKMTKYGLTGECPSWATGPRERWDI